MRRSNEAGELKPPGAVHLASFLADTLTVAELEGVMVLGPDDHIGWEC